MMSSDNYMASHGSTYIGAFDSSMNHISNNALSSNSIPSLSASTTDTSNISTNTSATTVTSGPAPLLTNSSAATITAIPAIKQPFPQYYTSQPQPSQSQMQGQYQIQTQQIPLQQSIQTQLPPTSQQQQQQQQPAQYYAQFDNTIDPYYQTQQYGNQYYYTNGIAASTIPYQYSQNFVPLQYGAYAQLASSAQGQAHAQVAPLPLPSPLQAQVQQYYYDAAATTSVAQPITNYITGSTISNNLDNGIKDSNDNSNSTTAAITTSNNNNNTRSSSNSNIGVSLSTSSTAPTINDSSNSIVAVADSGNTTASAVTTTATTTTTTNNNNNGYTQDEYTQLAPLPQLQAISPHLPIPFTSQPQQQLYFTQQQQPSQQGQLQTQPPFQLQPPIPTQQFQPTILPTIKPPVPSYRTVPHTNFGVITTMWEDENTLCYQVEANGVNVVRRADNNFINGTKLLNVTRMTRGRRDGMLKAEKIRHVVKIGSMHLKGVWIPFERAQIMAQRENILDLLYPLFVPDIESLLSGN